MFCIAILYSGNEGQRSYAKLNFQTEVKSAVVIGRRAVRGIVDPLPTARAANGIEGKGGKVP